MENYKISRSGGRLKGTIPMYVAGLIVTIGTVLLLSAALSQPGLAIRGIAIALVGIVVGLLLAGWIAGKRAFGPAMGVVLACQLLMFVGRPLYAATFQDSHNLFTGAPYSSFYVVAQLIAGAGFVSLCVGYGLGFRNKPPHALASSSGPHPVQPIGETDWTLLRPLLVWLAILGTGLYVFYIAQSGWSAYWQTTLSGRSEQYFSSVQAASGYLTSGLRFATGALLLLFCQAWVSGNRNAQVISLIFLSLALFPQVAAGSRSSFIPLALALTVFVMRTSPSLLPVRRVLLWLPFFFVLAVIAPRIWRDGLSRGGSLVDSVRLAITPDQVFGQFLGGLDTAMIDAFQVQVAAQANGVLTLQHGSTYLAAMGSWIPRSVWAEKPGSVDEILNMALFPETALRGIGFAFGFYSEPMFNFGVVGVCIVAALFGYFLGRFSRILRTSSDLIQVYVGVLVVGYSFVIMRGNLTFDIQRLLVSVIPVVACVVVARAFRTTDRSSMTRGTLHSVTKTKAAS